jgi:hypothetical protein
MAIELWDSRELYNTLRDERMDDLPSYILDTYFTEEYYSEDDKIRFSRLPAQSRVLAPFVLPTEQGKPIFSRKGETLSEITVPYMKPKDAVRPEDARTVRPSEIMRNGGQRPSIEQRFDDRVVEVMNFHVRAIKMRELWMAARGFIDGKVQIDYERDQGAANPSVLLDFGRDAGHTVTLLADYWNDPDTLILDNIEAWMSTMYAANLGGSAAMMLVGSSVAPLLRKNNQIKDMLDTTYRGDPGVEISRGMMRTAQPLKRLGQLDLGLEVWTYRDQVENANGAMVDIFDPRDVLLIAPGATGVRAHGAIYDTKAFDAGLANADIFPKMWDSEDPGERFLMHQSAKLPIPLYPNRTFKARVLA